MSTSPWTAPCRAVAVALCFGLGARTLAAQEAGVVSGQVTILEKPGAKTADLANAVVYLETSAPRGSPLAVTSEQIMMESRQFVPRLRVVTVGSTVSFPNQDPFRHNVFSNTGPREFDLGLYGRGESKGTTLTKPGVFPIFCNIHASMAAFVIAVSTPYFTQVGSDGRFTIRNVRPGKYALHVWHERGGEDTRPIEVSDAGAPAIAVQLDARGYREVQHKNKFGQDYPAAGRDRY